MRTPARLPCSPHSAAPARLPWRPRGRKPGEDPAGSPPPPPSPGAPPLLEPITPDRVGTGAVEDSPSPLGLAGAGACARGNPTPPPHTHTGKAQVKEIKYPAHAQRVTLRTAWSPWQLRGTPFQQPLLESGISLLLVRRRGMGFREIRLFYRTKVVASPPLRVFFILTVSLYKAPPGIELTAMLLPQTPHCWDDWQRPPHVVLVLLCPYSIGK